ncbi:hypothetical protein DDZ16_13480 [Marinilabilia rubra]|uniref:Uncharacterized protein n=1 Tax=Marinilabilia rubra TaxID=2162893 RepID=A0A2U2B6S2_9BACT|nr:hypothetical protein DDZ16_13480 [Marinilabilia rubra]
MPQKESKFLIVKSFQLLTSSLQFPASARLGYLNLISNVTRVRQVSKILTIYWYINRNKITIVRNELMVNQI